MGEKMSFPDSFEEFLHQYSFIDDQEVYTNGAELIPVFRVMQAWEHWTDGIKYNIDNIRECVAIISNNLYDLEDIT